MKPAAPDAAPAAAGPPVLLAGAGGGRRLGGRHLALLRPADHAPQLAGGAAAAFTVAVVSRLLLTVADLVAAVIGLALGRRAAAVSRRS